MAEVKVMDDVAVELQKISTLRQRLIRRRQKMVRQKCDAILEIGRLDVRLSALDEEERLTPCERNIGE